MSKCSKTRELVSELENLNQEIDTVVQAKLEEKYPGYSNIEDGIELELMERYNVVDDNLVNEEDLDEILEKKYPNDPKQWVIVKIMSLLSSNPLLLERVNGMILETYYLQKHKHVGPIPEAPKTTRPMLEKLDLGVLKNLLGGIVQIQRVMQGDKKDVFARGLIGGFHIAFKTPQNVGKLESTGAVTKFASSIYEYGRNISRRINSFYTTNPQTQEMGIEDIIQKFSTLPVSFTQEDKMSINFGEDLMSRRKIKFFTWLARGIIRKNTKTGKYEVATNYAAKVYIDDNGKRRVERYESTNDIMYQLQDYIPLSEYEDGYLDIPFTKDALIEIDDLIAKYREINERVRLAVAEEFTKSVKMVYNSMLKAFPELKGVNVDIAVGGEVETKALINALLFAKSDALLSQAIKIAEGVLSPEKFKLLQKLRKVYAGFIKDDRYFALFDNVNEKFENREEMQKKLGDKVETYFPVKYPEYHVLREFEMIRDKLERDLSMVDETKEPEKFENLERRLAYVTGVIEDFHDSPVAEDSGEKMVFQSRSRNYISYTGAMDIRNMKTDSGVYHDYLKYNFSQIERNRLTAKLIDSIIMTENEDTQDYLLDLYQVPFNGKNIKTRLGLFNIDPNRLSEKGKDRLDRWTQRLSAGLTFGYLGGMLTGVVNYSAIFQNVYKNSLTETHEMMRLYNNLNDVEHLALNNIIQRSGITDMSNFFGEALVDNIAETRLELEVQKLILDTISKYVVLFSKKGISSNRRKVLEQEMQSEIDDILKKSKRFEEKYTPDLRKAASEKETKRNKDTRKHVGRKIRREMSSAFVQYAINKRIPLFLHFKEVTKSDSKFRKAFDKAKRTGIGFYKFYSEVSFIKEWSMGATERMVRVVPFLIGIHRAMAEGEITTDKDNKKKRFSAMNEDEIQKLIYIGKLYSDKSNYTLSTTGLGGVFWGPAGRILGKFAGWSNQKMQDDADFIKQLYNYYKKKEKIEKGEFDVVAALKTMTNIYTLGIPKLIRMKIKSEQDYAAQQTLKFLLQQGITTMAVDLLFYGPFRLIRTGYRLTPLSTQRVAGGASSDLLSLMYIPIYMALFGWFRGDDEEEDKEEMESYMRWLVRRLPFGYGINWSFERMLDWYQYGGGKMEGEEVIGNLTDPVWRIGDPTGGMRMIYQASKDVFDEVTD